MKDCLRIIRGEHQSMAAVLDALKDLTRLAGEAAVRPDFRPFRAMIRYIDEYPEKLHHPKEDLYLFNQLERVPEARRLVERLESEHRNGARLMRELERALVFYEDRWPDGWPEFSDVVDTYCAFYRNHMRIEETELLPLAEKHFTAREWRVADEGFASSQDPIGQMKERDYQALFTRLVNLAPAPIGLGDPWRTRAGAR